MGHDTSIFWRFWTVLATEDVITSMYTFSKCCSHLSEDEGVNITTVIGNVSLELYRGPSQHNAPKFNERTLEVSLGLWFLDFGFFACAKVLVSRTKSQNAPTRDGAPTWYKWISGLING